MNRTQQQLEQAIVDAKADLAKHLADDRLNRDKATVEYVKSLEFPLVQHRVVVLRILAVMGDSELDDAESFDVLLQQFLQFASNTFRMGKKLTARNKSLQAKLEELLAEKRN